MDQEQEFKDFGDEENVHRIEDNSTSRELLLAIDTAQIGQSRGVDLESTLPDPVEIFGFIGGPSYVAIYWTIPSSIQSPILHYELNIPEYQSTTIYSNNNRHLLTNLTPGMQFNVSIRSVCALGKSPTSKIFKVYTESLPEPPSIYKIYRKYSSVELQISGFPSDIGTRYGVKISEETGQGKNYEDVYKGSETFCIIGNLKENTKYYIKLFGINKSGLYGQCSKKRSFKTLLSPPLQITGLEVGFSSVDNTVTFKWSPLEVNGILYELILDKFQENDILSKYMFQVNEPIFAINLSDFREGFLYKVYVRGCTTDIDGDMIKGEFSHETQFIVSKIVIVQ